MSRQKFIPLLPSFNTGEFSPYLKNRVDLEKYPSAARRLENFLILPYGGIELRPGMLFVGEPKHSDKDCRLLAFTFSTSVTYFIELGDQYARFWGNGGTQIESSPSTPLEIATPWLEADLFNISFAQINDVLFLCCPGYQPRQITRVTETNWTIAEYDPIWPPLLDINATATTLTPSALTGSGVTLTASSSIFTADHVGCYFEVSHYDDEDSHEKIDLDADVTSGNVSVLGKWTVNTYGSWSGTLIIERSVDNGSTWETVKSFTSPDESKRNLVHDGEETVLTLLRMRFIFDATGTTNDIAILETETGRHDGLVKVTGYTSGTVVTVDVIRDLKALDPTDDWAEGAWSDVSGYPRCVCYHEGRLYFGGSDAQPNRIWGSRVDALADFTLGVNADMGLSFQLASTQSDIIQWLASQTALLVGTSGSEWRIVGSTDEALTPTNLQARQQSRIGSSLVQVGLAHEATIFIERLGRHVREFLFDFNVQGYVSNQLSLLAEHLTRPGIKQVAYQQQYDSRLWMVLNDGSAATMTYERRQEITGWSRLTTQNGSFVSVAAAYGATDGTDEVWAVVKREINGSTVRYIERFDPQSRNYQEAENKALWCYLDSATRVVNSPASTTVSGLDHLEGETLTALVDGNVVNDLVVASGQVTLPKEGSNISIGIPMSGIFQPMPLVAQIPSGSSRGHKTKCFSIVLDLFVTLGFKVAENIDSAFKQQAYFRDTADPTGVTPPPFTGEKEVIIEGGFQDSGDFVIYQDLPFPCTILAAIPSFTVHGRTSS